MEDNCFNSYFELIVHDLNSEGYVVVDSLFSAEEISLLRANLKMKYALQNFKKAAVGKGSEEQVIETVRGDAILWLDENNLDEMEQLYFDRINLLITYLNRRCYLGIKEGEFHYACYPVGTFYKRHLDVFRTDSKRTLSVVFYLNEEEWEPSYGGELVIYTKDEVGVEQEKIIHALPGRMVLFDSKALEHEVRQVNQLRYSITGWLKTR